MKNKRLIHYFIILLLAMNFSHTFAQERPIGQSMDQSKKIARLKRNLKIKQYKLKKELNRKKIQKAIAKQKAMAKQKLNSIKKPVAKPESVVPATKTPATKPTTPVAPTPAAPAPIIIIEHPDSSTSTLDEIKKWGGLVVEIGGLITAIPTVIAIYYYIKGEYDLPELMQILNSKDKIQAIKDGLIKNGNSAEAARVEIFNKNVLGKVKSFSQGINSLKKNGIDISTEYLKQIRELIESPQAIAEDLGLSLKEAKNVRSAILEQIETKINKIGEKISNVDLEKLNPEEFLKFKELNSQFESLIESIDPLDLSMNPEILPSQANAEIGSLNEQIEEFRPALPEAFAG